MVAPGLMVLATILFMGAVSGAHLNPMVSLAFASRGDFPWSRVPWYVPAQLVGATLACVFLVGVFGNVEHLGATRRANAILRAAGLTAAPLDDPGVIKNLIKVIEGKPLSPILVVGGAAGTNIADGFHRVSLVYRIDPYGDVPLKLADVGRGVSARMVADHVPRGRRVQPDWCGS